LIVVADASVLIGLSSIGYLHLIQDQFSGQVLIPPAVWKEVVDQGGDRPGSHQVSKADWINVHDLKNQDISQILDILQNRAMFRISHTLYQQALKSVGEFNKE